MAKPVLGRGLGALLGGGGSGEAAAPATEAAPAAAPQAPQPSASPETPPSEENLRTVSVDLIDPCSLQPRKEFDEDALQELADSIKEQGIVQPLVVRVKSDNRYELIAGERRLRAAKLAKLTDVPIVIRKADDRTVLELALIENLQRENLNPIEAALGYSQLIEQFKLTQEQTATRVGKSRVAIANALRLLKLPEEIRAHVRDERISVGHAKVILGLKSKEEQILAARRVIEKSLSVRETEELVLRMQSAAQGKEAPGSKATTGGPKDPNHTAIENRLQERFGTKVAFKYRGGKGSIQISFFNDDDLDRILEISGIQPE